MLRLAEKEKLRGRKSALDSKVDLWPENAHVWHAFGEISGGRPVGFGVVGIPRSEFTDWATRIEGLRGQERTDFVMLCCAMDRTFVKWHETQDEKRAQARESERRENETSDRAPTRKGSAVQKRSRR